MKPTFVNKPVCVSSTEYRQWFMELKQRLQQQQVKAALHVNTSLLEFYWSLGRDLVIKKAETQWGSGVVEQLSLDLKDAFPNTKGFSTTNIWYAKKWYLFYNEYLIKLQQPVGEIPMPKEFGVQIPAISKHLANIFREGELTKDSVISILENTATDGKRYRTMFYNLDAILSVGYRVNSLYSDKCGTN